MVEVGIALHQCGRPDLEQFWTMPRAGLAVVVQAGLGWSVQAPGTLVSELGGSPSRVTTSQA